MEAVWGWGVVVGGGQQTSCTNLGLEAPPEALAKMAGSLPKKVWEVIWGGGVEGGIHVWTDQPLCGSRMLEERLSKGALLREIRVEGNRLCYSKISGSGPDGGWINIRTPRGKYLARCWMVRQACQRWQGTARSELAFAPRYLATQQHGTPRVVPTTQEPYWGIVEKLRAQGRLIVTPEGSLPDAGREDGNSLAGTPQQELGGQGRAAPLVASDPPEWCGLQPPKPRGVFTRSPTGRPQLPPWLPIPPLSPHLQTAFPWDKIFKGKSPDEFWQMVGLALGPGLDALPFGYHYRMELPWSLQQLREKGTAWLTKALHAASTLPTNNSVVSMEASEFVGGGACLKAILQVTYRLPASGLHEKLFVKYPFPYSIQRRMDIWNWVCTTNNDGPEIDFARLLSAAVPMRCPKYYFGDICPRSGVYLLITECLNLPPEGADVGPLELEPIPRKSVDYLLDDPFLYYDAIIRNAARLGAWGANGRLGYDVLQKFAPPEVPTMLAMGVKAKIPRFLRFAREVAPQLFEPGMVDDAFAKSLFETLLDVEKCQKDVFGYLLTDDANMIGLTHQNMNIDNAFFWRDAEGHMLSGFIDWGRFRQENYAVALLNGLLCCDLVDFLGQRDQRLLEAFCEEYAKEHRPGIVLPNKLLEHYLLAWTVNALWLVNVADTYIYPSWELTSMENWSSILDYKDPRVFHMPNCNSGYVAMIRQFASAWKCKGLPAFWAAWRRKHLGEQSAKDAARNSAMAAGH